MSRAWLWALLPAGLLGGLAPVSAFVPDDEMAPSIYAGDLVVLRQRAPRVGDVVAIVDPLDPARWTLRRAAAIGGAVRFAEGIVHTSEGDQTVLEMGRDEHTVTMKEGDHLVQLAARPVRWSRPEAGIPDDAVYLAADNRDEAMDSRWWGPLPLDAVRGVVVVRIGPKQNRWRSWLEASW